MEIKRVTSTVLFEVAGGGRAAINNALVGSLFLFSETSLSTHLSELAEAFFTVMPELEIFKDYIGNIWINMTVLALCRIMAYYIFMFSKKSFVEQGSFAFRRRTEDVMHSGVAAYLILLSLGVVFFISAVGIPFVIVLFAIACFFSMIGETSIAIAVGRAISRAALKAKPRIETDLIIGAVILELLKFIPAINVVLYIAVIPVISLGVVITTAIDGYIRKIMHCSEYQESDDDNAFNYGAFRDIILGKAKEGEEREKKDA